MVSLGLPYEALQSQVTRILKTLRLVRVFRFIMALRTLAPWSMDTAHGHGNLFIRVQLED
jgi:hypothetical protein